MNVTNQSPSLQHDATATGNQGRWLAASLIWIVAGFLFPLLLGPATGYLATGLQGLFTSGGGFSDQLLAYRVAVTLIRIPLTALMGILVAVAQFAVVPGVQVLARRWLIASAIGGAVSTLVLLPSSLVLIELAGSSSPEMVSLFLSIAGASLFGGFVSFSQRRSARRRLWVPAWVVAAGFFGASVGAWGGLPLAP
jgi:hypothetical protein